MEYLFYFNLGLKDYEAHCLDQIFNEVGVSRQYLNIEKRKEKWAEWVTGPMAQH